MKKVCLVIPFLCSREYVEPKVESIDVMPDPETPVIQVRQLADASTTIIDLLFKDLSQEEIAETCRVLDEDYGITISEEVLRKAVPNYSYPISRVENFPDFPMEVLDIREKTRKKDSSYRQKAFVRARQIPQKPQVNRKKFLLKQKRF